MPWPLLFPRPMLPLCPQCQLLLWPSVFPLHLDSFTRKLELFLRRHVRQHLGLYFGRIMALLFNIGCLLAAFVPLLQRSAPACLESVPAAAWHRILVGYALRRSLDGYPTGPPLVSACMSFCVCLLARVSGEGFAFSLSSIIRDFEIRNSPPQRIEIKRCLLF